MPRQPLEDRFLVKVDRSNPVGCWEWLARRNENGYGTFKIGKDNCLAHRVMYELTIGDIKPGFDICHHCDNPGCVFPFHLYQGTHDDNMRDKVERGRSAAGEKSPWHKLTSEQVDEIRRRYYAGGITQRQLANEFGLRDPGNVSRILAGQIWVDHSKPKPSVPRCNKHHKGSGYKGVRFQKGRWNARVKVSGREISLGRFDTAEEAAHAYDAKATEIWGNRAYLNFPGEGC